MVLVGTRRISEKQPKAELPSKIPSLTCYQVHWIWLPDLPLRPCLEAFEVSPLKINPFRKMIVVLKWLTEIIWDLCIIYYEKSIFVRNSYLKIGVAANKDDAPSYLGESSPLEEKIVLEGSLILYGSLSRF